ncbi:MAG: HNH endonuclease [bacterium]|nr:HNH endonuclease [bacterium]
MGKLTQHELKELLHYEPNTGIFTWKEDRNCQVVRGDIAGTPDKEYYTIIKVNRKQYKAHRLAWLYYYGSWPENEIDHINRINNDNRIVNLRDVFSSCNSRNSWLRENNSTGVSGVNWHNSARKWYARITNHGIRYSLGRFDNFTDAVRARWKGEIKYGYPNCNSTSSAYLYLKEKGEI